MPLEEKKRGGGLGAYLESKSPGVVPGIGTHLLTHVGVGFWFPHTTKEVSGASARHPPVQLRSDTVYMEVVSNPTVS